MSSDKTYNGWTNYETWVVKLWIDNEQSTQEYWREVARNAWTITGDKTPNQSMNRAANARYVLAEALKYDHDEVSEHPVFAAANGTVFADLLNAALSEVNWNEIADSLLDDIAEEIA